VPIIPMRAQKSKRRLSLLAWPSRARVRVRCDRRRRIDAWIAVQGREISSPEAIRRLVEIGLRAKGK
jgi:hypothetical protein